MLGRLIQLCIQNNARLTIDESVVNVFINSENWICTCVGDAFEDNIKCCIDWFETCNNFKLYDEMTDTYF